jgi:hypothetical protein
MVGSARITHGWPRPAGHGAIPIRTDPPKKKAERGCAVGLGIGLEGRLAYVAHDFPLASAEQCGGQLFPKSCGMEAAKPDLGDDRRKHPSYEFGTNAARRARRPGLCPARV